MKSHVVEAHKMQGYKYQCDVCTKRFEVKSAIRKHYRHNDTENIRLDKIFMILSLNIYVSFRSSNMVVACQARHGLEITTLDAIENFDIAYGT
jgi:hypothetical protein